VLTDFFKDPDDKQSMIRFLSLAAPTNSMSRG
jgi:hypothetical protein